MKMNFKSLVPHIVAIVVFLLLAVIYCKPALEGKVVAQHDIQGWRGMSEQSKEFHDKYGYYPLWTNSMFSGMPAYQIAFDAKTKLQVGYLDAVFTLGLGKPLSFFFLACISFYFLCVVAGVNPWLGILGGIAYAYSSFDPIIIAVGHNSQMASIGYAPAVIAGLLLLFRRKYWVGFAVTAVASSLLIGQNHIQIVYYVLIMAGFMTVAFLINAYKQKELGAGIKAAAFALIAGVLGLACNAVNMLPTYEYAKETMRGGKSQLTLGNTAENKTKGGLDKDYAFRWSYAIPETFTVLVPGLYGGSNGGKEYSSSSKFVQRLAEVGVPEDSALQYADGSSYWGEQPFTSGPVYLGAVICFLFIFGLFYVEGWQKWWIVAASVLGILMAWGYNFKSFNYFLFDYLPFYNKFRAPAMSLFIPQFCFPLLGILAVDKLLTHENREYSWKKLKIAAITTGAVLVLLLGFYFTSSFSGSNDKKLKDSFKESMLQQSRGQQPSEQMLQQAETVSSDLMKALREDRKSLMGGDLLRTIALIAVAAALMWLFYRRRIQPLLLIIGLILLSSFDLVGIDKRYLNDTSFEEETDFEGAFNPTEADQQILKDPDHANFRVFNQTADAFNDALTSYHHNSIGGYHPAKLGLYQDIIEHQLSKGNMRVYNMLNTKYFIVQNPANGKPMAQQNPDAFGNCWLVKGIKWVNNANEEMLALDSTNVKDTAIIDKAFAADVPALSQPAGEGTIKLKENINDKVLYTYQSAAPQFAVFSEVYYNKGWNAYVDGKKSPYVKVDYVLRGMSLPAGNHEIEFRMEPKSFTTGRTITIISNILIILVILASIGLYWRNRNKVNAHVL